jgi:hypothetical protein
MSSNPDYPVRLTGGDDLGRSRLTVLFRLVLLIPHVLALMLYGLAAFIAVIAAWFVALVSGRVLPPLHDFLASYVRYSAYVIGYAAILTDPFPPFNGDAGYALAVEIDPPVPQNRLTVLFRAVLVLPCMLLLGYVLDPLLALVAVGCWVVALVTGRVPAGLQRLGLWILRFRVRSYAYALLVNPRYPSFGGDPAAGSLPADQASLPPLP